MSASLLTSPSFGHGAHLSPPTRRTSHTSFIASSRPQQPTMKSLLGGLKKKLSHKSSDPASERHDAQPTFKGASQRLSAMPQNSNPFVSSAPATRRPNGSGVNAFSTPSEPPPPYSAGPSSSNDVAGIQAAATLQTRVDGEDTPFAFLRDFDTIFLIDDSGSMAGGRWEETREALKTITPICTKYDDDGIDIYFLNFRPIELQRGVHGIHSFDRGLDHFKNITNEDAVTKIFNSVRPRGATPTGKRLRGILNSYISELERGKDLKPVNIIVITDGEPSDNVDEEIIQAARRLDKLGAPISQVGVQFFQVGHDPGAREHLKELDDGLRELSGNASLRDIVDTVPFTALDGGKLTAKGILKVVLGSVNKRIDRKSEDTHRPVVV